MKLSVNYGTKLLRMILSKTNLNELSFSKRELFKGSNIDLINNKAKFKAPTITVSAPYNLVAHKNLVREPFNFRC